MKLNYTQMGEGDTAIIFLHGVCMSSRFFQKQIKLAHEKLSFYFVDFPSHGDSEVFFTGNTINAYAHQLRSLILSYDLKQVVFVGWSMGALVAWEYLLNFGDEGI